MPKDVILTPEGLANLKSELELLSTTRRREVAARIKEAREFGDISENAEYDDAKNEQAMLEARIAQLEDRLRSATVIDASKLPRGRYMSQDTINQVLVDEALAGHRVVRLKGGDPFVFGRGLEEIGRLYKKWSCEC